MGKTRIRISIMLVLAVLLISACGPKNTTLNVELKDFEFTPTLFTVPAGREITLKIKNIGTLEHEFVIMNLGTQATLPFSEDDEGNIYWEIELDPNMEQTVKFNAPSEPGEYEVVCGTAGHLEVGMKGRLVVTE
jgi:uncharacterized cupredoxin-like copper-binding protein